MPLHGSGWNPTAFRRFSRSFGSALSASLVDTDIGWGYLKGLGTREGPHPLAAELLGTSLAEWLGLPTLDYALLTLKQDDEIPIYEGQKLDSGPAFITRAEDSAFTWGGDPEILQLLSNPETISQLVVIDTWLRNCDRYAPDGKRRNRDNVMFIKEPLVKRSVRLIPMDFTHAFTCGEELTRRVAHIEYVKDERIYGLFPEFVPFLKLETVRECQAKLKTMTVGEATQFVQRIPSEWHVEANARSALGRYITERAHFLADHIETILWPQRNLYKGE